MADDFIDFYDPYDDDNDPPGNPPLTPKGVRELSVYFYVRGLHIAVKRDVHPTRNKLVTGRNLINRLPMLSCEIH